MVLADVLAAPVDTEAEHREFEACVWTRTPITRSASVLRRACRSRTTTTGDPAPGRRRRYAVTIAILEGRTQRRAGR